MKEHALTTSITHLLVLIYQKKKIAVEIAAQIARVNGPLANFFEQLFHINFHKAENNNDSENKFSKNVSIMYNFI